MTIPREALEAVRTVVAHSYPDEPCADGLAAALIVHDAFLDVPERPGGIGVSKTEAFQVRFVSFNTRAYDELEAEPNMLFVDMSPPAARVQEFVDAGAIVLDHHATARPVVEAFGERGVFGDERAEPGLSGALLAYRHVWRRLVDGPCEEEEQRMWSFAELVGVRDTWQTRDPRWREATMLTKVLRFFSYDEWRQKRPFVNDVARRSAMLGETLMRRDEDFVAKLIDSAWRFETALGTRVLVLPSQFVSDAAESLRESADVVVGFSYRSDGGGAPKLRLSFRSRGTYDVGALAASLGGGGHRNAAGAALPALEAPNPYTAIVNVFGRAGALGGLSY